MTGRKVCDYRVLETGFCNGTDLFLLRDLKRAGHQEPQILDKLLRLEGNSFLGLHLGKNPEGVRNHLDCFVHMTQVIGRRIERFSKCLSDEELWDLAEERVLGSQEDHPHAKSCELCSRDVHELERQLHNYMESRHIRRN